MIDRLRALLASMALLRFIVVGSINTIVTFFLFMSLSLAMPVPAAYTVTYILGIALSYALNTFFVFRTELSLRTALRFPLVYLVQYLYGLAVITMLTGWIRLPNSAAMLLVVITSIPLTFVLSRRALVSTSPSG